MVPPSHIRYLNIDLDLNNGIRRDLVDTFGTDASYGSQFASLKLSKVLNFVENLTKVFKFA